MRIGFKVDVPVDGPAITFAASARSLGAGLVGVILCAIGMHFDEAIETRSTGNDNGLGKAMLVIYYSQKKDKAHNVLVSGGLTDSRLNCSPQCKPWDRRLRFPIANLGDPYRRGNDANETEAKQCGDADLS